MLDNAHIVQYNEITKEKNHKIIKEDLKMKYIVKFGMNAIESNSRNAKQHLRNLGGEYVRIETKRGEFVCSAKHEADGSMWVCTCEG